MAYKKTEQYEDKITSGLVKSYADILGLLGEDPEREGLKKTPERLAKAMQYLTQGYHLDARSIINSAKFHEEVSEMIVENIVQQTIFHHNTLHISWLSQSISNNATEPAAEDVVPVHSKFLLQGFR